MPALQNGSLVLADRWNVSAYVYRGLEGYDLRFVKAVNSKIPQADLTIVLDLPVKLSLRRGEEAKKPCPYTAEQLEQARKLYGDYARTTKSPIVDATQPLGTIFEQLRDLINMRLY